MSYREVRFPHQLRRIGLDILRPGLCRPAWRGSGAGRRPGFVRIGPTGLSVLNRQNPVVVLALFVALRVPTVPVVIVGIRLAVFANGIHPAGVIQPAEPGPGRMPSADTFDATQATGYPAEHPGEALRQLPGNLAQRLRDTLRDLPGLLAHLPERLRHVGTAGGRAARHRRAETTRRAGTDTAAATAAAGNALGRRGQAPRALLVAGSVGLRGAVQLLGHLLAGRSRRLQNAVPARHDPAERRIHPEGDQPVRLRRTDGLPETAAVLELTEPCCDRVVHTGHAQYTLGIDL